MAVMAGYHSSEADEQCRSRKRRRIIDSSCEIISPKQNNNKQIQGEGVIVISSSSEREDEKSKAGTRRTFSSRNASPPWRSDDKDGHYVFELGENLTPRYKILSKLGQGTFGQALECWDRKSRNYVVIKVVRGIPKYREAAKIEIEALRKVAKHDKNGSLCVQMMDWFDYRNHMCIVFEKLGPSLYDLLQKNNFHPYPIDLVRDVGRQLLESVAYMHDLKLVHTDLKPENVLFITSEYKRVPKKGSSRKLRDNQLRLPVTSAIKLIDFGSTTFEHQDHTSIVSTRHYRAPEVILGLGWNYPCDIWSIGCILVELIMGETLFQTHENLEHLAMMERVLGPLPTDMIKKTDKKYAKYFRHGKRLDWPEGATSTESIRTVKKLLSLGDMVNRNVEESASNLTDLLGGLLMFDPSDRLTAHQALKHSFFQSHS